MKHTKTLFLAIFVLALVVINAYAQSQIVVARGQLRPPFTTQTDLNRRANDIVKLYGDVGITVDDIPDNALTEKTLANAKLVILPLNAPLPNANLQALKNAVAKGCRIIAFQPADNDVCGLLGIKPLKTPPKGKFEKPTAIVFSPMPGMPEKLEQSPASTMRLITLPKNGATTIGIYTAENGSATGQEAVTLNKNGVAFAQTLLIKDRPATTKMLLALTDTAIPGIWETPARKLYETIGVIGGYTSLAELAKQVGTFQPGEHSHALAQAIASAENAQAKLTAKQYAAAYLLSEQAQLLARKAYRLICRPRPNELRGAWIHSAYGISNWGWDKTIRVLSENGFNAIFANMLWGWHA